MLNMDSTSYAAASADTVDIVLPAFSGQRWSIGGISWSYEGGEISSGAQLFVTATNTAGSVFIGMDIGDTSATYASDVIAPSEPFKFPPNTALHFELGSGGTGVLGKITILGHKLV